jgi:hypothetical protein
MFSSPSKLAFEASPDMRHTSNGPVTETFVKSLILRFTVTIFPLPAMAVLDSCAISVRAKKSPATSNAAFFMVVRFLIPTVVGWLIFDD